MAAFVVYAVFCCLYYAVIALVGTMADALVTLVMCIALLIWFVPLALALWFAYRAYQGEQFEIAYVTAFLKGQGWL